MSSKAPYIDIHTHLTHEKFSSDWQEVLKRAIDAGLRKIVVNGLEPESNRKILAWSKIYPEIVPALGIYPLEAVNALIPENTLPFQVEIFDVDSELHFIEESVRKGEVKAIGECGLDGYWIGEETFPEQERVFKALIDIALRYDLPIIIHTRKREKRSVEILLEMKVKKVNFHCYGGKTSLAIQCAQDYQWWFSIPANARKNEAFTKMLLKLPEHRILTETDAPFLAPEKNMRNEPANVCKTVEYFSELKGWSIDQTKEKIYQNYCELMEK